MAVAKHMQGDKVNYSILAKLSLGIQEMFDYFVSHLRGQASSHYCRLDVGFLEYLTFQINLQKGLAAYFSARHVWDKASLTDSYGVAIRMLKESEKFLETR